ncbi:MAG: LytR C-terminal domain-containing protein, partial [Thermoleophilaceae bacterium]
MAQGPAPTTPAAAQAVDGDGDDDDDEADSASASEGEGDVTAMDTVVHPPPAQDDDERSEDEDREREQGDEESGDGPDAADEDRGDAGDDTGEWDPEDTGEWGPEDEHSDVGYTDERDVVPATPAASAPQPPQPPRPYPRRPLPAAGAQPGRGDRTAVLPPYAESRPQAGAHGGSTSRGRRPLAIAAAAIVALALAGFAALQLTAGDDEPTTGGLTTSEPAAGTSSGPVDPGDVTVAVLNGTTVPGLAAALGDQLDNQGFRLGTVTNNFDQARAESVVLYAPAAEREAAAVGRRLDISQREPIDPSSQSLAGDASVVVVAGA